jgi:hypothetical protein
MSHKETIIVFLICEIGEICGQIQPFSVLAPEPDL